MTINEVEKFARDLEKLNVDYWFTHDRIAKADIRKKMAEISKTIYDNGFKLKKKKTWDNDNFRYEVKFIVKDNKHKNDIDNVDNRPKGKDYRRDCTTRCICFCTGEDYEKIRSEQFKNANILKRPWRNIKVWSRSLLERGFSEISLPRKMSRATFLKLFKDSGINSGTIATLSSGHIAAIDMAKKKVLDIWDSTGGRIYKIYVPNSQYDLYNSKLKMLFNKD